VNGTGGQPLVPGTVVDGFRLEGELPAGAAAALWRVTRPGVDFPLVLKVPRAAGEGATELVRFQVEQLVLPKLAGPHVPRFVATGEFAGQPYLVTELVAGASLHDRFAAVMFSADDVARLGARIAVALRELHRQLVAHLDLKPRSVIFRKSGEVVLVDFGLARHAQLPDLIAEQFRVPLGTAAYISPEQVLGVRHDPRSDVFALGVILYELTTGQYPYGAPTSQRALRHRLWHMPMSPRRMVPSCPEWLQEVILRCLEPQAADRYASAAQVAADLTLAEQVTVSERGRRLLQPALGTLLKRWIMAAGYEPSPLDQPSQHLATASIVLVAVPTLHKNERRFQALREVVKRLLLSDPDRRLACVCVIPPVSGLAGGKQEEAGTSLRIEHLVRLRHWAESLALPPEQVSYHVIESGDPAAALVEYARFNQVDHLVIGAPPAEVTLKAGFIATRVAGDAPCSVTVVRVRAGSGS
jgi:eukaryotic-like serine/threonine-protein kinase